MPAKQTDGAVATVSADGAAKRGAVVELSAVTKRFRHAAGEVHVLDAVDCSIKSGDFVSLLGPSGCGKSTLLRLIAGLIEPTGGSVAVDGIKVVRAPESVGMVFQEDALLRWRSVLGNVLLPAEIRKDKAFPMAEAKARALELLERVGLAEFTGAWPAQLSGGMKQRAAICQALLRRPRLLLMDEPFGALDALTREQMQRDLQELWMTERSTVVFVTHSISEAVLLSDRVLVFSPRPARILADLRVDLPRPRDEALTGTPEFRQLAQTAYDVFRREGVLH